MNARMFTELPVIEDMTKALDLRVGFKFLNGTKMIAQQETKKVGDEITYYEVTFCDGKGYVSYKPVYDKLEE